MGRCSICGRVSGEISEKLGACVTCIRDKPEKALPIVSKTRERSRERFMLPPFPPRDENGIACGICMNDCKIGKGKRGFCGLVSNVNGRLVRYGGTPDKGVLEWYYDSLPTNCVAWWFCPGCTGRGYPKYAYTKGPETGYYNLAIFYGACSFDCLFCQNWHYRNLAANVRPTMSAEALASKVGERVSCICYFGGDPSPQMPHAIKTSELALERAQDRILRICWESNGYMREGLLDRASLLSFKSGGVVKFDLKAYSDELNQALCGVSNKPTLKNFERVGERFFHDRPDVPLLTASTLLVPGYVDEKEVEGLASFIASVDVNIPYTLLAFHPHYVMNDLSTTRRKHALACLKAAEQAGLRNVRLGNVWLLS